MEQVSSEPSLNDKAGGPPKLNPPVLQILGPKDILECQRWVGVYRPGTKTVHEAWAGQSLVKFFQVCAEEGLNEGKNILLPVSFAHKTAYCLCAPFSPEGQDMAAELAVVIQKWCEPQPLGFFLAKELFSKKAIESLLCELLTGLIPVGFQKFYLYTGSFDKAETINIAVELKARLKRQQHDVMIYH